MTGHLEHIEVTDPEGLVRDPLVTVLMITYNHGDYIAAAIEGVVSQQCDFPFELIIGEDASSDRTLEIALDYQRRYPHIIRLIHAAENVGMRANWSRILGRARGEFIAYCEGDDYWCSPHKLARQVDLIRGNARVGVVHADWVKARLKNGVWKFDLNKSMHSRVPLRLLQGDVFQTWYFPRILRTCTILLRRQTVLEWADSDLGKKEYKFGDTVQSVYVTSKWLVAYLPEVVAIYHESPNSALRSGARSRVAFYKSCLDFDTDARAFFSGWRAYGAGYRWEADIALLLWAIRARDIASISFALKDIRHHFRLIEFVAIGYRTMRMRWPTFHKQRRILPNVVAR